MNHDQQRLMLAITEAAAHSSDGLAIYAENRIAVAVRAFSCVFPTVQRLLGDAFFAAVRRFIVQCPPAAAELTCWAEGFADWLALQAELAPYPYIAAVAMLEWHKCELERGVDDGINLTSFHLAEHYSPSELQVLLNPHARLMKSHLPIFDIWMIHQSLFDEKEIGVVSERINDSDYVEYLYMSRQEWNASLHKLTAEEYYLLSTCNNKSLGDIISELDTLSIPLSTWLTRMVEIGALWGYSIR